MTLPLLKCPACRREYPVRPGLFSCPDARAGEEHTLERELNAAQDAGAKVRAAWSGGARRTFAAFADLLSAARLLGPDRYAQLLGRLTGSLERLEGRGFEATPLLAAGAALARAIGRSGPLWIKDETGNIAGSHKGRHLMATLLYLEALRILDGEGDRSVLAIYSCGNAALAASAVARAGGYELHAFVPAEVDPVVAQMLAERGAFVEKIARAETGGGDPCYRAFQEALVHRGWLPFACAGNDNWSNIEGGATLGWELLLQLADRGGQLDCVVLQVGGGALARAVSQSFHEALALGVSERIPRIHVCQPEGGFPFVRAYYRVMQAVARRCGLAFDLRYEREAPAAAQLEALKAFAWSRGDQVRELAGFIRRNFDAPEVRSVLSDIPFHVGRYMWPWDGPAPHSLAHGILDDVTYDWYPLLRAVLRSGGQAEVLREEAIRSAYDLAHRHTGIRVCPTGAAGLAGLIQLTEAGVVEKSESAGLFFTGFDRSPAR
ncbi:MAG: pyridoxal-phosphate dependent enzyme [Desulfobacterales bacterium]|jgi:threonine synthase|nr:pyridoxal-phosphate dependent enzyme [Desulfobacterales bacterium]